MYWLLLLLLLPPANLSKSVQYSYESKEIPMSPDSSRDGQGKNIVPPLQHRQRRHKKKQLKHLKITNYQDKNTWHKLTSAILIFIRLPRFADWSWWLHQRDLSSVHASPLTAFIEHTVLMQRWCTVRIFCNPTTTPILNCAPTAPFPAHLSRYKLPTKGNRVCRSDEQQQLQQLWALWYCCVFNQCSTTARPTCSRPTESNIYAVR